MFTKRFYEEHNLTRAKFAELIGVGQTVLRYREEGHRGYNENDIRVDIGVQIVEDYKMWWPSCNYEATESFWRNETKAYDKYFKRIFDRLIKIEL